MGGAHAESPSSEGAEATDSSPVIGIDLGTTYSCVAVHKNGRTEVIANDQGNRITPSYVAFDPTSGERLIGDAAKNQAATNPEGTIFDVKRLIGRNFNDRSVQADMKLLPYQVRQPMGSQINSPLTGFLPLALIRWSTAGAGRLCRWG
jgi:endoplasmic reticulum chaperone BiP